MIELSLRLAQTFLEIINDLYGGGVGVVEDGEVVADPVAEEDQIHHLAECVFAAGIDNLVAYGILLQ